MTDRLAPAAREVAELVAEAPAMPSGTRLVCIEGPAGAGKTTLADRLRGALTARGLEVAVVHLDDVYDGWDGLDTVGPTVRREVVEPVARGSAGSCRRYDWHAGRYAEPRPVPVTDVLVVEGVGAGHPGYAACISLLVWVEAPAEVRRGRGLRRDGEHLQPQWRRWMVDEQRLHARERSRERADVMLDGVTGTVRRRGAAAG